MVAAASDDAAATATATTTARRGSATAETDTFGIPASERAWATAVLPVVAASVAETLAAVALSAPAETVTGTWVSVWNRLGAARAVKVSVRAA